MNPSIASPPTAAERPSRPIKLHRMALSGHCHRVELLLSLLDLPYELVDIDTGKRAHKSEEFLAKNAFGQVPVIEDGEVTLADSDAILIYLEARYAPGLEVIEWELQARPFLAGDRATLADLANSGYVALAPEGTVPLGPFPAIHAWLARIEALPGFVPMTRSVVEQVA